MGVKNYGIKWTINDAAAQAAFKRGEASLRNLDKLSLKTITSMEGALARAGKGVEATARAGVNGHNGVAAAAAKSADAQVNGVNRVTAAAVSGSAKRLKAAVGEQEKIHVGLYKLKVDAIKFNEDITHGADREAKKRRDLLDRDARKAERDALGPYGRLAQVRRKDLSLEQLHLAAKNKFQDAHHNKQINRILKEQYATQDNFRESIAAALGLDRAATGAGQALMAVAATAAGVRLLAGALAEARDNAKRLGEGSMEFVVRLRPLASVMGVKPDTAFAEKIAGFGKETGMGKDDAAAFLESFAGRAQITRGVQISDKEFDKFAVQAGRLAASKGMPNDVAGDLFGGILKTENFLAKGQGADEATARAATALKILDAGSGRMPILGPQFSELLTLTKEDELEGVFRNAGEAAVVTSLMAEYKDEKASVSGQQLAKGLRDFGKKGKGAFFKRTGITDKDSTLEALDKAIRVIDEDVKKGVPVDQSVRGFGFKEERQVRALTTAYGARDTVLKPQLATLHAAEGPGGVEAVRRQIAARMEDEDMRFTAAKAGAEAAEVRPDTTAAAVYRKKAEEEYARKRLNTSFGEKVSEGIAGAFSLGTKPGHDSVIDAMAIRLAQEDAGVKPGVSMGQAIFGDTTETIRLLKEIADTNKKLLEQQKAPKGRPVAVNAPAPIPVGRPPGQAGR